MKTQVALLSLIFAPFVFGQTANATSCDTANHEYKQISCSLKNKQTQEKMTLKITCQNRQYVYSLNHSPKLKVIDTIDSLMEQGVNWELVSFILPQGIIMLESKYKTGPGAFLPIYNGFYSTDSKQTGEQLEKSKVQGTCWAI